jgi:hypothetical protein
MYLYPIDMIIIIIMLIITLTHVHSFTIFYSSYFRRMYISGTPFCFLMLYSISSNSLFQMLYWVPCHEFCEKTGRRALNWARILFTSFSASPLTLSFTMWFFTIRWDSADGLLLMLSCESMGWTSLSYLEVKYNSGMLNSIGCKGQIESWEYWRRHNSEDHCHHHRLHCHENVKFRKTLYDLWDFKFSRRRVW